MYTIEQIEKLIAALDDAQGQAFNKEVSHTEQAFARDAWQAIEFTLQGNSKDLARQLLETMRELAAANAKIERLEVGLSWYADKENWNPQPIKEGLPRAEIPASMVRETRAQEALTGDE